MATSPNITYTYHIDRVHQINVGTTTLASKTDAASQTNFTIPPHINDIDIQFMVNTKEKKNKTPAVEQQEESIIEPCQPAATNKSKHNTSHKKSRKDKDKHEEKKQKQKHTASQTAQKERVHLEQMEEAASSDTEPLTPDIQADSPPGTPVADERHNYTHHPPVQYQTDRQSHPPQPPTSQQYPTYTQTPRPLLPAPLNYRQPPQSNRHFTQALIYNQPPPPYSAHQGQHRQHPYNQSQYYTYPSGEQDRDRHQERRRPTSTATKKDNKPHGPSSHSR